MVAEDVDEGRRWRTSNGREGSGKVGVVDMSNKVVDY